MPQCYGKSPGFEEIAGGGVLFDSIYLIYDTTPAFGKFCVPAELTEGDALAKYTQSVKGYID